VRMCTGMDPGGVHDQIAPDCHHCLWLILGKNNINIFVYELNNLYIIQTSVLFIHLPSELIFNFKL